MNACHGKSGCEWWPYLCAQWTTCLGEVSLLSWTSFWQARWKFVLHQGGIRFSHQLSQGKEKYAFFPCYCLQLSHTVNIFNQIKKINIGNSKQALNSKKTPKIPVHKLIFSWHLCLLFCKVCLNSRKVFVVANHRAKTSMPKCTALSS